MRRIRGFLTAIVVAASTAGCSSDGVNFHRYGIGSDLNWSGLENSTRLLNTYISAICNQAGLGRHSGADTAACHDAGFGSRDWGLFVQAGMNDIDLRCDSYLAWLDDRRRSSEPVLKQIAAVAATTVGIMGVRGASPEAISIVGQAFGLAADTFTNLNARLLMAVEQSTVQAIVLRRRDEYRVNVSKVSISNRPAAIHALRSYLNLCMPFTIEMEINTTVTAYERGGPAALNRQRLIHPRTVASASSMPSSGMSLPAAGGISRAAVAPRAAVTATTPPPAATSIPGYSEIFEGYDPRVHTVSDLEDAQRSLCVPSSEYRKAGALTRMHIVIFRQTVVQSASPTKLSQADLNRLDTAGDCPAAGGARNFFERTVFYDPGTTRLNPDTLAAFLNRLRRVEKIGPIESAKSLADPVLRRQIANARRLLGIKDAALDRLPMSERAAYSDQITFDLYQALPTAN